MPDITPETTAEASTHKRRFFLHPVFIIFVLFIAGFFIIQQYTRELISDRPVELHRANPPSIIMYSTRSCMYCYVAREFFKKHQLPYTEYDIELSDKHMQTFYLLGGQGTPLLVINKDIIHGYDEQMIRDAL